MTGRYSILVIDGSADDRQGYLRQLHDEPIIRDIRTAETGEEGIDAFEASPPDCVLLDHRLPDEDGLAVLKELRALDPTIPIIVLTGQGHEDIAVASLKRGASDYVVRERESAACLRRAVVHAIKRLELQQKIDRQQHEHDLFLRTLIHDAKAPLRHISMFAELLDEDIRAKNYEAVLEYGDAIVQSAKRIQSLIDMLAAYALTKRSVEFEPVSMNEIAEAAIGNLSQTIEGRKAEVSCTSIPTVEGHAPQLIQLLQNLIANGVKHCNADTPDVAISADRNEKGAWQFQVEDNGVGIAEDRLAYIFQPFKRLWSQDAYEGTGLGLTICKKIVERHGGEIWCRSKKGVGSTFLFTLGDTPTSSSS